MWAKGKAWICVAGMIGVSAAAAEFVPPAEGPVAFRRDRIPLEADAMAGLSQRLEMLARGMDAKSPVEARGVAQLLALALALDPGNTKARNLMADYRKGRHKPNGDAGRMLASRRQVWQVVAWLESPGAGVDGQALAACIKDVMCILDPTDPKVKPLLEAGELGAWAGWVPAISEYETKPVAKNDEPAITAPVVEAAPEKGVLLEKAEVQTPLWQASGKSGAVDWFLIPAPLQMTATKAKPGPDGKAGFSIEFGRLKKVAAFNQLGESLKVLLEKQNGPLPKGVSIRIDSNEFEKSIQSGKRQSISAAAAVLASSALSGRVPDAIIIGQMDEAGAFTLPTRFWYQLKALGPGKGERLVLPSEAGPYLPSILAMEHPEFFFGYEVVLASNFAQLIEMSAKMPDEPLASASAKFREIRERAGSLGVRAYIDNSFVKQRLAAVLQDMPSHVSAKMLLIQASGNRPGKVSRKVLAAEIRRALELVPSIRVQQDTGLKPTLAANVGEVYESCRSQVDGLDRYVEKEDRDLIEEAREVAVMIRNLDRVSRSRADSYTVVTAVQKTRAELMANYNALIEKIIDVTGDGPDPTNP